MYDILYRIYYTESKLHATGECVHKIQTMKVLSLSTAIFSAFLASRALASGAAATIIEQQAKQQINTPQEKLYLRQKNPLVNPNDLIATSDSDAADSFSSSTTAKWLFTDEQEAIELGQNSTTTSGPNWKVEGCCETYETIFLCCFAAYLVVIKLLWNTFIMKPMKLVAVFVHGELPVKYCVFQNRIGLTRV